MAANSSILVNPFVALDVSSFLGWGDRARVCLALNRELHVRVMGTDSLVAAPPATTTSEPSVPGVPGVFWEWACEQLAKESGLYMCAHGAEEGVGWRGVFQDLRQAHLGWRAAILPLQAAASAREELFREQTAQGSEYAPGAAAERDQRSLEAASAARESMIPEARAFKMQVMVRFRPAAPASTNFSKDTVRLPLHQRVQLWMSQLGCTKAEAMRLLMKAQGHSMKSIDADPFAVAACPSTKDVPVSDKENRGQPNRTAATESAESSEEESRQEVPNLLKPSILSTTNNTVLALAPSVGLREFHFNHVLPSDTTQEKVYQRGAQRLVADFVNGNNGCLILYGQTGSGKTFTAFGPEHQADTGSPFQASLAADKQRKQAGLVPRACEEVFAALAKRRQQRGTSTSGAGVLHTELSASYVEVFGNEVSDLLKGGIVGQQRDGRYDGVRATDRVGHRYVLDGQTEVSVGSVEEIAGLLATGEGNKRKAATAMNLKSTRAHAIFILSLVQYRELEGGLGRSEAVESKLLVADLGGSEKLSKSRAAEGAKALVAVVGDEEVARIRWNEYYASRKKMEETLKINLGLFSLQKCIDKLNERQAAKEEGRAQPYVPFQDSKLTKILEMALGGDARTMLVVTAAPESFHALESIQALRFAERCSNIVGVSSTTNGNLKHALSLLDAEIVLCEQSIKDKERWEQVVTTRSDDRRQGDDAIAAGDEVVVTAMLTGAENERARLEELLLNRRELAGSSGDGADKDEMVSMLEMWRKGKSADWYDANAKAAVLMPHEKRLEKRFTTSSLCSVSGDGGLAEALEFVFRKARGTQTLYPAEALGQGRMETESLEKRNMLEAMPSHFFSAMAERLLVTWKEELDAAPVEEQMPFGKCIRQQIQKWCESELTEREAAFAPWEKDVAVVVEKCTKEEDPQEI